MGHKGSIPSSQESATGLYPKPDASSPQLPMIHPSWSLPFRFFDKIIYTLQTFHNKLVLCDVELLASLTLPKLQAGGPSLVKVSVTVYSMYIYTATCINTTLLFTTISRLALGPTQTCI